MPDFKHILFPVDFSERCRGIRPSVVSMARRFHSKPTLPHIVDIPAGWYGNGIYPVPYDIPAATDDARARLDRFFEAPGLLEEMEKIV